MNYNTSDLSSTSKEADFLNSDPIDKIVHETLEEIEKRVEDEINLEEELMDEEEEEEEINEDEEFEGEEEITKYEEEEIEREEGVKYEEIEEEEGNKEALDHETSDHVTSEKHQTFSAHTNQHFPSISNAPQSSRPKRHRARQVYTPSPPPRFSGEPKKKREKLDDSAREAFPAPPTFQELMLSRKISWAKEPPHQIHSASARVPPPSQPSSSSAQSIIKHSVPVQVSTRTAAKSSTRPPSVPQPSTRPIAVQISTVKEKQMDKPVAPVVLTREPSAATTTTSSPISSSHHHETPFKSSPMLLAKQMFLPASALQQAQRVVALQQENEKLTREIAQLKHTNQEQQQQIQALISANRELIWAFNESRKEHDELMRQIKSLVAANNQSGGGNGSATIGVSQKPSGVDFQRQGKKRDTNVVVLPVNNSQPQSQTILKNKQQTPQQNSQQTGGGGQIRRQANYESQRPNISGERKTPKNVVNGGNAGERRMPNNGVNDNSGERRMSKNGAKEKIIAVEIKKELEPTNEPAPKTLTKAEEIAKIKSQLNSLKVDQDVVKLLGPRRPAFFTPKEFGDWHSVVSGDFRKHLVLKIFQALCPEVNQKSIEDYNKAYPSRVDYIKKSVDFSFATENELFIGADSRDAYLGAVADKIFTLCETILRFSTKATSRTTAEVAAAGTASLDSEREEKRGGGGVRRRLADALKRPRQVETEK